MSANNRSPADEAVDRLRRRIKPAGIVVDLPSGGEQKIDLLDRRGRWERVKRFLDTNDWTAIRCYSNVECSSYLDTVTNADAEDPTEEEAPIASGDSPEERVRRMFETAAAHVDKMMVHFRGHEKDMEDSRMLFIQTMTAQYAELQAYASDLFARYQEAIRVIEELKLSRSATGDDLSEKEKALFGIVDAAGQKFFGLPPMGLLKQLAAPGSANGSGKAAAEGDL